MVDTNGNDGAAPKWAWVAKLALSALGVVIMLLLADLRGMQAHLSLQADALGLQVTAMERNMVALSAEVSAQRVAVDAALARLHYFRSDDDHDWQQIKERILRLEIRRERERPTRDGGIP